MLRRRPAGDPHGSRALAGASRITGIGGAQIADIWWVALDDPLQMPYLGSMAKKQTRRSISVSKNTYERLRTYCESNGISMSQFIERRVGDYLTCSQSLPEPAVARDEPAASTTRVRAAPTVRATPDQIFTF